MLNDFPENQPTKNFTLHLSICTQPSRSQRLLLLVQIPSVLARDCSTESLFSESPSEPAPERRKKWWHKFLRRRPSKTDSTSRSAKQSGDFDSDSFSDDGDSIDPKYMRMREPPTISQRNQTTATDRGPFRRLWHLLRKRG